MNTSSSDVNINTSTELLRGLSGEAARKVSTLYDEVGQSFGKGTEGQRTSCNTEAKTVEKAGERKKPADEIEGDAAFESLDTSFAGRTTVAKPPPQTPVKPSGRSPSSLPSKTAPTRPHQRKAPGLAKLDLAAADPVQTSSKRKVDELAEKSTPKRRRSVKKKPAERPGEEVAEEAPLVPKEVGAFLTPPEKPLVGSWKCSICTSWNSQFWATCRGFVDESGKQGRCPRTKSQNAEEEKGEKDGWEKEEKHAPGEWLSRYCGTWNDKFETLCAGEGDHLPMGGASCSDPKEAACEHKIERTPLQKYCDSIHVPYLRE